MAQNVMAVISDDIAYTSPSTALNQNESVKVYANAPIADAANTAQFSPQIFCASIEIVQNRNKIVKLEQRHDMMFIIIATLVTSPKANKVKKRPMSWKVGAPGG